jgi:hypothetical protein
MSLPETASAAFAILAAFPILGQLALVLGAPWGSITLGGRWPGVLPPRLRLAALAQSAILVALAVIALDHGGLLQIGLPPSAIWVTVAVTCVSAVLNNITPSRIERRLWGPVTILMALAALTLAFT